MSLVSSESFGVPSFPASRVWKKTALRPAIHHRHRHTKPVHLDLLLKDRRHSLLVMSANTQEKKATGSKDDESRPSTIKPVFYTPDGKLIERSSLSSVVSDAVKRWYNEAEREASRGDVKAMALLGQMLMEGYGCDVDVERGKQLAEKARRRGYRMHRVYCEI